MKLDNIQPGDVLKFWHDTVAMGPSPVYAVVLRKGAKMLRVRDEYSNEGWRYPHFFYGTCRPTEWVPASLRTTPDIREKD